MTSQVNIERLTDTQAMQQALSQAGLAGDDGEVPVGAVVVREGQVIAVGRNAPIGQHDPTAHAEMVALRAAAKLLGNYRLDNCTLFVSLEPCAMCAGAMLHARLQRVVFGATDPKTGAAGSVINLFANPQLNHQTQLSGGLLAEQSTELLQVFFKGKREAQRATHQPVRDDALRTPQARFNGLPDYPWQAKYLNDLSELNGLRLAYIDEGPLDASLSYLCLHGPKDWNYYFRAMIPELLAAGSRVVAPDLIGFGQSDKPKKAALHQFNWHRQVLLDLVERLNLENTVLVLQNQNDWLGLSLPLALKSHFCGLWVLNLDTEAADPAYEAPFTDRGHRTALRAFPLEPPEPVLPDEPTLAQQITDFWQQHGSGQTLVNQNNTLASPVELAQAAVRFFEPPQPG